MERLSPKGDRSLDSIPLGRMGDGGECSYVDRDRELRDDTDSIPVVIRGRVPPLKRRDRYDGHVLVFRCRDVDHRTSLCESSPPTRPLALLQVLSCNLWRNDQVVDGGATHVQLPALAYPESVLDPEKVKSLIARL
jgi:hypothetical protein